MRKNAAFFLVMLAVFGLDQAAKAVIARTVGLYESRTVIPGFFNLTRVHNRGAVFGAFSKYEGDLVFWVLTVSSLAALALVAYIFSRTPASETLMKASLAMIMGGAAGNLADRISRGFVVDFLDFHIGRSHWPFFNVADSAITVGVVIVLFLYLRRKPPCIPS
jgi:signal peptidase II